MKQTYVLRYDNNFTKEEITTTSFARVRKLLAEFINSNRGSLTIFEKSANGELMLITEV